MNESIYPIKSMRLRPHFAPQNESQSTELNRIQREWALTKSRIPGMASTRLGEKPLARNRRWTTIAPTTTVMKLVQMRKASLYLRAVLGENSKMKLQLILLFFHMNKLHPYMNKCKLSNANMLKKYAFTFSMSICNMGFSSYNSGAIYIYFLILGTSEVHCS